MHSSKIFRAAAPWALLFLLPINSTFGAAGDVVRTFNNMYVSDFAIQPHSNYMYATLPNENSLAVFNMNTLTLEGKYFVGSMPRGMAFSADGSTLYVANSGAQAVVKFDTSARLVTGSLSIPYVPTDVELGNNNRLFVLGSDNLRQFDATTGLSAGPFIGSSFDYYSGQLEISPDRNTLFYADNGLSPASLYKFDVSSTTAQLLWESPHGGTSGFNGQDLTLSHNGEFISYPCGAGQLGYSIAKYDTDTMSILGSFNTGAYPREIAFSPDDEIAYTVHTYHVIDLFSTSTFTSMGSFTFPTNYYDYTEAYEMEVTRSGNYLFAATSGYSSNAVYVFDTGRSVPEVTPFTMLGLMSLAAVPVWIFRRKLKTRRY